MVRNSIILIFTILALNSCRDQPAVNPGNLSSGLERARLFEKNGNPDSAVIILNQILRESAQTGDSSVVAPASLELGHHYLDRGNYSLAKVYYAKVIASAPANPLLKARALTGMGSAMANTGQYPEAVKKYHEAMEIFLDNGDSLNAYVQLQNLAVVHSENGKYELASQFNQRAIAGFMLHGDSAKFAECFINQAIYHKNLGKEPVLDYYDRAAGIFTALGDSGSIIKIVYNKAVYLIPRNPDQAVGLLDKALEYSQRHGIRQGEVMALNALSDLNAKTEPVQATLFATRAYETAQIYSLSGLEFKTLKTLSLRLNEQGLHAQAASKLFRLNELRDSLNLDQNNKAAFELQQLYQVTALEQKNLLLTRENEWRRKQFNVARNIGVLMSAFALAVSVLLVIVYRFYVSRKLAYHALFDIYRSQKPVTDFTGDQGNTGAINTSTED